jgi:phosphoribosylformylglycinamidine cyclo-ligase
MSDSSLTYRASGVDVEANNEANERIKAEVLRTHDERVLTRPGLFGGAISLTELLTGKTFLRLVGAIAADPQGRPGGWAGAGAGGDAGAPALVRLLRDRLGPQAAPLAFLDYLATARLEPLRAADLVGRLAAELLEEPRAVLIGGETAEMPGTFREGSWEVVGALFGLAGQAAPAGSRPGAAGKRPWADLSGARSLAHPALVFSMDGVGTKTRVAVAAGRTAGLAEDIIHHSLNDILCQGARGLAMCFYLGCHGRDESLVGPLSSAIEERCRELGLSVLDLTVCEKPQVYLPGEIDLCAAVAGLVDADRLIQGAAVRAGDRLLGLASSGLHTNGYSLARRALLERGRHSLGERLPELGGTLAEALLEPHRCYAPAVLPLLRDAGSHGAPKAVAHVTGGGLAGNLVRVLPDGLGAEIRLSSWEPPPLFRLIQKAGNIPEQDCLGGGMYETFNMGIGLVLVVDSAAAAGVKERLETAGEEVTVIGAVVPAPGRESQPRVALLP